MDVYNAKSYTIIGSKKDKLEDIVRDMKKHTSLTLKEHIKTNNSESRKEWMVWMFERAGKKNSNNKDWQFWQQHNKPLEIKDQEMLDKTLDYIHHNPIVAGFVNKAEDWKYSSARDFYGMRGLIELSYRQYSMAQVGPQKGSASYLRYCGGSYRYCAFANLKDKHR